MRKVLFVSVLMVQIFVYARGNDGLLQDLAGKFEIVVDKGGTGDYTTVQAAIDAVPDNSPQRTVVLIKKGKYYEKVRISSTKKNLVLIGEDLDSTIIYFDDYAALSGFDCTTVKVDANDFLAMNLTIENSFDNVIQRSQALALATYGDRQVFLHCKFVGFQDTYFSGSDYRAYFKDCLFIGAVDYIYGPTTIILDSCQIHNVRQGGGYITAASTPQDKKYGYVFRNCWITSDIGVSMVDLGRPWRPYAQVTWLNCYEGKCVSAGGWNNWGDVDNEATARYEEYKCFGPGSDFTRRVDWCSQLTDEQAAEYTMENIFAAASSSYVSNDWMPDVDSGELYSIVKKHTIKFLDPTNVSADLSGLKVDGEDVAGFHPDSTIIGVEIPPGSTAIPVLEATAANPATTIEINYPDEVPGFATINVFTRYKAAFKTYQVYFSQDGGFHSADIIGIKMNGWEIPNFDPDITTYNVHVPEGTSRYMSTVATLKVKDATYRRTRPDILPGTYEFEATAVDGYTLKTYEVNVDFATTVSPSDVSHGVHMMNPISDQISGFVELEYPGEYMFHLFSVTGSVLKRQSLGYLETGVNNFQLNVGFLAEGNYLYSITGPEGSFRGQLVKISHLQ